MRVVHITGRDILFPKLVGTFTVGPVSSILSVLSIFAILTESGLAGIRSIYIPVAVIANSNLGRFPVLPNSLFPGIRSVHKPVAIIADGDRRRHGILSVLSIFAILTESGFASISSVNIPVAIIANGDCRRYSITTIRSVFTVFTILTVTPTCADTGILFSDKPVAVITYMRCLSVLSAGSGQETPEILYRVVFGGPFLAGIMRVVHATAGNHVFPLLESTLTILPVFAIFSLEKLEEVSDFCLILRPVDGSIRNFFLPKLVG